MQKARKKERQTQDTTVLTLGFFVEARTKLHCLQHLQPKTSLIEKEKSKINEFPYSYQYITFL